MVGFITSLIIAVLLVALIFPMAKRRPVGTPLTWGEAMVGGACTSFFVMFWAYGVVPRLWLAWADGELHCGVPIDIWIVGPERQDLQPRRPGRVRLAPDDGELPDVAATSSRWACTSCCWAPSAS